MNDDLGDSDPASPGYGGKAVPGVFRSAGAIWPAALTQVNLFVYSDSQQQVDLQMLIPGGGSPLQQSGTSSPNAPFMTSFNVAQEGRHLLQTRLSKPGADPARLYIKVSYLGPATSNLF